MFNGDLLNALSILYSTFNKAPKIIGPSVIVRFFLFSPCEQKQ